MEATRHCHTIMLSAGFDVQHAEIALGKRFVRARTIAKSPSDPCIDSELHLLP